MTRSKRARTARARCVTHSRTGGSGGTTPVRRSPSRRWSPWSSVSSRRDGWLRVALDRHDQHDHEGRKPREARDQTAADTEHDVLRDLRIRRMPEDLHAGLVLAGHGVTRARSTLHDPDPRPAVAAVADRDRGAAGNE